MDEALPFSALGAGNGFPGCLAGAWWDPDFSLIEIADTRIGRRRISIAHSEDYLYDGLIDNPLVEGALLPVNHINAAGEDLAVALEALRNFPAGANPNFVPDYPLKMSTPLVHEEVALLYWNTARIHTVHENVREPSTEPSDTSTALLFLGGSGARDDDRFPFTSLTREEELLAAVEVALEAKASYTDFLSNAPFEPGLNALTPGSISTNSLRDTEGALPEGTVVLPPVDRLCHYRSALVDAELTWNLPRFLLDEEQVPLGFTSPLKLESGAFNSRTVISAELETPFRTENATTVTYFLHPPFYWDINDEASSSEGFLITSSFERTRKVETEVQEVVVGGVTLNLVKYTVIDFLASFEGPPPAPVVQERPEITITGSVFEY